MKGQKNEILTRQESQHLSRPNVFYFFATAHFLKQLPTHIAHIAKAPRANASTKALSKSLQSAKKSKSDEFYTQLCDIERELNQIPVTLQNGETIKLSAGKHNEVQAAIVEQFAPRLAK